MLPMSEELQHRAKASTQTSSKPLRWLEKDLEPPETTPDVVSEGKQLALQSCEKILARLVFFVLVPTIKVLYMFRFF